MEVHKHPHHVTHKKKWGEYLLEFFMLFLAVFLGFVAENIREHQVEKARAKEYVTSFREDLSKDTAILQSGIQSLIKLSNNGDSLITLIQNGRTKSQGDIKKLYEYNITSLSGFLISLNDRTEAQLKNSGGLRLITNKKVIDGIVDYWKGAERSKKIETDLNELRIKAREKSYLIFDSKFYAKQFTAGQRAVLDDAQLMTKDYITLTEFSNRIAHIKNLVSVYILFLKVQNEKSDSLMVVIDKEY
ncbi:MAG: hypothetical protein ABIW34_03285 [Ginsengibacter sp.]